jgi:hypothetical protein
LDATHFRNRAARARELAKAGEDPRLAQMLLEVAVDLDAEAEAIDAEQRDAARLRPEPALGAVLSAVDGAVGILPVQIIDISLSGAKFRAPDWHDPGSSVVLQFPTLGLHLEGTIVRTGNSETAMEFDIPSRSAPGLARLLRSDDHMDTRTLLAAG